MGPRSQCNIGRVILWQTSRSLHPRFFTALAALITGKPIAWILLTNCISPAVIVLRGSFIGGLFAGVGGEMGGRGVEKRFRCVSSCKSKIQTQYTLYNRCPKWARYVI